MNIYWESPLGRRPPQNAVFGWLPFLSSAFLPSLEKVTRVEELPPPSPLIPMHKKTLLPNKEDWSHLISLTLNEINLQKFSKVVLARSSIFESANPIDPFAVASYLRENTKNCTLFCFASETMAFLGASPEILFQRKHRIVQSDILAGTAPRGKTEEEDRFLEQELLKNPKALREWEAVRVFLETQFSSLCIQPPHISPLQVKKLSHVQHLSGQIQGILLPQIKDEDILQKLHPTPALCGTPTNRARNWIVEHEPFHRGLYGGAIGWSTREESEWVVAIRSCLIQDTRATVYTGAGIVEGSNPDEEWEELNHKMALYQNLFTLENG